MRSEVVPAVDALALELVEITDKILSREEDRGFDARDGLSYLQLSSSPF